MVGQRCLKELYCGGSASIRRNSAGDNGSFRRRSLELPHSELEVREAAHLQRVAYAEDEEKGDIICKSPHIFHLKLKGLS
jgi:hypothetical protein